MKLTMIIVGAILFFGCAEVLENHGQEFGSTNRVLPKAYVAPTAGTILNTSEWQHVGQLEVGGKTQLGRASGLVAFDAHLRAGQDVTVRNFSDGWTSIHIFGARPSTEQWETIKSTAQSAPIDAKVEGSEIEFTAPFSGHYLFMVEPIARDQVDYLIRLDCAGDC